LRGSAGCTHALFIRTGVFLWCGIGKAVPFQRYRLLRLSV
jgi:hypothetical protein